MYKRQLKTALVCALLVGSSVLVSPGRGAPPDLVGWWKLDETSGLIAADASGNGNDGTLKGDPQWAAGMLGGAIELDGTGDYVDCGAGDPLNLTDEVTIACWMKVRTFTKAWQTIVGKGDNYQLERNSQDDVVNFYIGTPGRRTGPGVTNVNDGEWHHVAGTYDGAAMRLYIDGTLDKEAPNSGPLSPDGDPLYMGESAQWPNRHFDGWIDDVRVFGGVLTADHIQDLYEGLTPDFHKAGSPSPAEGDIAVTTALLTWSAGVDATLHDVYLGTSPELTEDDLVQPRSFLTLYYHVPGVEAGTTYYWRIDEIQQDGTVTTGDVWSFTTQAVNAYYPAPADGAVDASTTPELIWLPGQSALQHQVYFSDNRDDVTGASAAADQGAQAETTFAPGDLDSLATYYWRVDELLDGGVVQPGPVWTFTTYLVVDDMESYNDELDAGTTIFDTWIDGWVNGTGSLVGYLEAPFAEQTIVNSGAQSMPLDYNNVDDPFYSEAEREWPATQDWTARGIGAVVLLVRGQRSNDVVSLYVAIEDSSGNVAIVVHPDPEIVQKTEWTEWRIALGAVGEAGVNLTRVKKMYIGVGDRDAPAADGAGLLFIDDIRLTLPEPESE